MLKEIIMDDFKKAFKSWEKIKKDVLGVIKTKISLLEKEKEVDDIDVVLIIQKEIKNILASLEYANEGTELYEKLTLEKNTLEHFLPKQKDEWEVVELVKNYIEENNLEKKDFWRVMWNFSKELKGIFDNKKLKDIIEQELV